MVLAAMKMKVNDARSSSRSSREMMLMVYQSMDAGGAALMRYRSVSSPSVVCSAHRHQATHRLVAVAAQSVAESSALIATLSFDS